MSLKTVNKLAEMHMRFGKEDGLCRDCSNFRRYHYRMKTYSKCSVYGISMSAATDWNGRNQACGMLNKEISETPVYKRHLRVEEKDDKQMSLLDYTEGGDLG